MTEFVNRRHPDGRVTAVRVDDGGRFSARAAQRDRLALDTLARMLRNPEWYVSMLEDAAEIVGGTGRNVTTPELTPEQEEEAAEGDDPRTTWHRH